MNRILFLILFFSISFSGMSQSTYAPLNNDYYHLIDRYEIRSGRFASGFHTTVKPYERKGIAQLADSIAADSGMVLTSRDRFNLQYLQIDNHEWSDSAESNSRRPILNTFYTKKPDLFHYNNEEFDLHINPVLYLQLGRDTYTEGRPYLNSRGVEVRGMINKKVGFYTFVAENQALFPEYVRENIRISNAVPHEGFWKTFKNGKAVDFLTARGYISFKATKNIAMQFGHDRHFIGNGYRSMILSDFSNNYLFLKVNTNIWKLNYTNLFAQMTADIATNSVGVPLGGKDFPKKYMAMHRLGLNIGKHLNIGVFETIMFGNPDSLARNSFDINYLNPIIFYRSVDQNQGSPNNALLGADLKWNFLRHFSLYAQLTIDEFVLSEVKSRSGWWANKQAGQIGLKYIDALGIKHLDLQAEANIARPYTYGHGSNYTNYTHYLQPLAHPLGANFFEYIGILRFQPIKRLHVTAKGIYARFGEDTEGSNWGTNPLYSYRVLQRQYGNKIAQGINTQLYYADMTLSYQLRHNLFIDLTQVIRKKESALPERNRNTFFTAAAIRWNIAQRLHEF